MVPDDWCGDWEQQTSIITNIREYFKVNAGDITAAAVCGGRMGL
jgi:hypothetical protein